MTVLESIIDGVREDLARRRLSVSAADLQDRIASAAPAQDALQSLGSSASGTMKVIAEVKRTSPSK